MSLDSGVGELAASKLGAAYGKQSDQPTARPTLMRWLKFNFVGGLGIAVQFAALFVLKSALHFHYLVASAIAVEAAVLHNFFWHERFTWADRIKPDRIKPDRNKPDRTRRNDAKPNRISSQPGSLRRLLRFHLANGVVSIIGNLALMKVMVGHAHMNYLLANAIAIALCSAANFLLSDEWVFDGETG